MTHDLHNALKIFQGNDLHRNEFHVAFFIRGINSIETIKILLHSYHCTQIKCIFNMQLQHFVFTQAFMKPSCELQNDLWDV